MHERQRDLLSALAAGPPPSSSLTGSSSEPPSQHHRDAADEDEDLHAADGLEEFRPHDGTDWRGAGGFDSRGPVVDACVLLGRASAFPLPETLDGYADHLKSSNAPKSRAVPVSSYALSGTPALGQFGTPQLNKIGRDPPREIVRVERDWVAGDVAQCVSSPAWVTAS